MRMKLVNRRISSNIGWNIGLISFIFVTSFYYNNPPEIFSRRINENPLIEFNEFLNTSLYILFVKSIKLSTLFHKIIESLENWSDTLHLTTVIPKKRKKIIYPNQFIGEERKKVQSKNIPGRKKKKKLHKTSTSVRRFANVWLTCHAYTRAYLVILARIRLDIGVIQRATSSSTGSRAWTDLNLEQRHDRFDRTVPLRGNFICRPSRPWASSASTRLARTLRKSPDFRASGICIIAADAAVYYCAAISSRNSSPSPSFSASAFFHAHLLSFFDGLTIYIYMYVFRIALLYFFFPSPWIIYFRDVARWFTRKEIGGKILKDVFFLIDRKILLIVLIKNTVSQFWEHGRVAAFE